MIATETEHRGFVFIASSSSNQPVILCRHRTKCLPVLTPESSQRSLEAGTIILSILQLRKRGSERASDLPRITRGVNDRARDLIHLSEGSAQISSPEVGPRDRGFPAISAQRPPFTKGHPGVITSTTAVPPLLLTRWPCPAFSPPIPPVPTLVPSLLISGQAHQTLWVKGGGRSPSAQCRCQYGAGLTLPQPPACLPVFRCVLL